jgi:hypothetical protein
MRRPPLHHLQQRCDLIRSATRFHWWPLRIKKRHGLRALLRNLQI